MRPAADLQPVPSGRRCVNARPQNAPGATTANLFLQASGACVRAPQNAPGGTTANLFLQAGA